ncbi:unnamed protein product, partial [Tetraodon nigroviridis]
KRGVSAQVEGMASQVQHLGAGGAHSGPAPGAGLRGEVRAPGCHRG